MCCGVGQLPPRASPSFPHCDWRLRVRDNLPVVAFFFSEPRRISYRYLWIFRWRKLLFYIMLFASL